MQKEIIEIIARLDLLQLVVFGYIGGSVALFVTVAIALYQWASGISKRTDGLFEQASKDTINEINIIMDLNKNIGILTEKLNTESKLREQQKEDQEKLCDERHKD